MLHNQSTSKLATSQDLCQCGGFFMDKEYWSDIRNVMKWIKSAPTKPNPLQFSKDGTIPDQGTPDRRGQS